MHHEALTKEGKKLFPKLAAFSDFYLAGGTALALQIGHRVSVDFDFFSSEPIPRTLLIQLPGVFEGSSIQTVINNRDELTVLVDGVKITFLTYPFPVITSLVSADTLKLLSVAEIGATKAYSIGRRGTYKDYVDLYFILRDRFASLEEIVAMATNKFGNAFDIRLLMEQLLYLDDIGDYKIEFLRDEVAPAEILELFRHEIQKLPVLN